MEDIILKLGHTYLIRYGTTDTVHEVKILIVTDKAYQVKWQSGSITWELKSRMNSDYTVIEDITIIGKDLPFDWLKDNMPEFKVKFPNFYVEEPCDICDGYGQILNNKTTSCRQTCPACNGSGKKSKKITLSFD